MKPNLNYIPRERLEEIARNAGCTLTSMAACIKVAKGSSKNLLYIASTKECARVDLSGFDHPNTEWVRNLGGESFGRVHQMLRFDRPVKDIKESFKVLCEGLESFQPHPKKERVRPASFRGSKKKGAPTADVQVKSDETPKEHMERLVKKMDKIKEYSRQTGIPVSPKTIKEFEEQIAEIKKKIAVAA